MKIRTFVLAGILSMASLGTGMPVAFGFTPQSGESTGKKPENSNAQQNTTPTNKSNWDAAAKKGDSPGNQNGSATGAGTGKDQSSGASAIGGGNSATNSQSQTSTSKNGSASGLGAGKDQSSGGKANGSGTNWLSSESQDSSSGSGINGTNSQTPAGSATNGSATGEGTGKNQSNGSNSNAQAGNQGEQTPVKPNPDKKAKTKAPPKANKTFTSSTTRKRR